MRVPKAFYNYNKLVIMGGESKRAANITKHSFDFADASSVYRNPSKLTLESARKSEDRRLDLALVEDVLVAFVYVERASVVRAISLRRASRAERRVYEKAIKEDPY